MKFAIANRARQAGGEHSQRQGRRDQNQKGGATAQRDAQKGVPTARYVLPDLDYDYGALEPHISGQIMELHHASTTGLRREGQRDAGASWTRPATRTTSRGSRASRRRWPSTSPATCCTRSSGRTCPQGRRRARRASWRGHRARLRQLRRLQGAAHRGRGHGHGLGLGRAGLGADGQRLLTCQIYDHQSNLSQGGVP